MRTACRSTRRSAADGSSSLLAITVPIAVGLLLSDAGHRWACSRAG
ncbi:MAG: hypothetical protein H6811_05005 [Phycisphaeraceae bacterium]|nr:hypothetical protein [Phycisphaeraceae bacterium]